MAMDSMVLPVTYMRSLCKKDEHIGGQMVLSGVPHAVAEKFVHLYAALRVNKKSRVMLIYIRKAVAKTMAVLAK